MFVETSVFIFSVDEFWGRKILGNFEIVYKTAHCRSGVPRGGLGGFKPPPPNFRSFDKVEPDWKL